MVRSEEYSPFGLSNGAGNAAVGKKSYLLIHIPAWLREHGIQSPT